MLKDQYIYAEIGRNAFIMTGGFTEILERQTDRQVYLHSGVKTTPLNSPLNNQVYVYR
jgi:hypothetical protein